MILGEHSLASRTILPCFQQVNQTWARHPIEKLAPGQRSPSKKHLTSMSCQLAPVIWSRDTGQRPHRRAYAPTSNTASHDNHEKINSWVSFCFPYMGCLWGSAWRPFGPPELRYHGDWQKIIHLVNILMRKTPLLIIKKPQKSRDCLMQCIKIPDNGMLLCSWVMNISWHMDYSTWLSLNKQFVYVAIL